MFGLRRRSESYASKENVRFSNGAIWMDWVDQPRLSSNLWRNQWKRLVMHYVMMQCNIYRMMLEPEAFLQSSSRRLKSDVIIRFNESFHCFRTSRSLLWPLKWNSRFLFVIMTHCFTSVACLEGCTNTIYF